MTAKGTEHLKRTWERQPDLAKASPGPQKIRSAGDKEFDPRLRGTNQESEHNKPERAQKGAPKH